MKKSTRKNLRKIRKITCWCIFFVITLRIMLSVTWNAGKFSFTILKTQFQLVSIYDSIYNYEIDREDYERYAKTSGLRVYQKSADECDKQIKKLAEKRKSIVNSDNSVIAFAAKNGVSIFVILLGASIITFLIAMWTLSFYQFKIRDLILCELKIAKFLIKKMQHIFLIIYKASLMLRDKLD